MFTDIFSIFLVNGKHGCYFRWGLHLNPHIEKAGLAEKGPASAGNIMMMMNYDDSNSDVV